MTSLEQWALRWGLPPQALGELAIVSSTTGGNEGMSEAAVQSRVRLEASQHGIHLWRNNVGGMYAKDGRFVRYGLANDSEQLNKKLKSADLIGWRPLSIGPERVGQKIAQFVSRECKRGDWQYAGTEEENAQLEWAKRINAAGGDALIVSGPGSFG